MYIFTYMYVCMYMMCIHVLDFRKRQIKEIEEEVNKIN